MALMGFGKTTSGLDGLVKETSKIGLEVTDIAGDIALLSDISKRQVQFSGSIREASQALLDSNKSISGHAALMNSIVGVVGQDVYSAKDMVSGAAADIYTFVNEVQQIAREMVELRSALDKMTRFTNDIQKITKQVNMLALNATIEAARAGEHGRGFAVVAGEVRTLANETDSTNREISQIVEKLTEKADILGGICEGSVEKASRTLETTRALDQKVEQVAQSFHQVEEEAKEIAGEVAGVESNTQDLLENVRELNQGLEASAGTLGKSNERIGRLIGACEELLALCIDTGNNPEDEVFLRWCKEAAAKIENTFERALKDGEITMEALFDDQYEGVAGSNPKQVVTGFTKLTDRYLPEIQEPMLEKDERIVFCAAVDRNGYLPTHNTKFSQPQGSDVVWNASNCRNRRIFDDRVGLSAGRSMKPFLIQMYRRDMGGGQFALMKDLSVPIVVRGKHWGGLRLAYHA